MAKQDIGRCKEDRQMNQNQGFISVVNVEKLEVKIIELLNIIFIILTFLI